MKSGHACAVWTIWHARMTSSFVVRVVREPRKEYKKITRPAAIDRRAYAVFIPTDVRWPDIWIKPDVPRFYTYIDVFRICIHFPVSSASYAAVVNEIATRRLFRPNNTVRNAGAVACIYKVFTPSPPNAPEKTWLITVLRSCCRFMRNGQSKISQYEDIVKYREMCV